MSYDNPDRALQGIDIDNECAIIVDAIAAVTDSLVTVVDGEVAAAAIRDRVQALLRVGYLSRSIDQILQDPALLRPPPQPEPEHQPLLQRVNCAECQSIYLGEKPTPEHQHWTQNESGAWLCPLHL